MIALLEAKLSNTQLRIFSASILLFICIGAALAGPKGLLALVVITGLLTIDEFQINLMKSKRMTFNYFFSLVSFVYCTMIFLNNKGSNLNFVYAGFFLNVLLLGYLFLTKIQSMYILNIFKKNSYLVGIFFFLPFSSFLYLLKNEQFILLTIYLLLINSFVDIGGWYFGKKYGNKKLMPKVSPKKTIIGAIGGVLTSVTLGSIYSVSYFQILNISVIICLFALAFLSQCGDLFQSKIKRQYSVKDSSRLIPGHGGIYDRIDSLVFVAPFFVMMIKNLY